MSRVLTGLLCTFCCRQALPCAQTRDMSSSGVALDRVIAIVNEGVVLQSQLDDAERPHRRPPAEPGLAAAARRRHPPAGARAPDPPGDPGAARRAPRRPGAGRDAERGAARRRQAQQHRVRADAARARAAGHRLRDLPRGDAPRDHAVHAAPARRVPAHLRLAARGRAGARARREPGGRQHGVRRLPHPAFAAGVGDDRRDVEGRGAGARHPRPRGRRRGFRPARARLFEGAVRARARQARLAAHGPACRSSSATSS